MEEFELVDFDFNYDEASAYYSISPNVFVEIKLNVDLNKILIDYEPDGDPTYVPYGERMVLYDDGKGQIESIDASETIYVIGEQFYDEDNNLIDSTKALELLGKEKSDFQSVVKLEKLIGKIEDDATLFYQKALESYYLEYPQNLLQY